MSDADDWKIFQRTGEPHDRINRLEEICPPGAGSRHGTRNAPRITVRGRTRSRWSTPRSTSAAPCS